jgi:sugar phosphate isomerase/epimerase
MNRLSINEMTTFRWSFEEDVSNLVALDIKAIGVWRHKLSDFGEERGVDLLADSGLSVSNLLWAGGFTGSEGRSFRESIEDAEDAIRLAASMQAGCLIIYSGSRNGHTQNHARRLMSSALQELLPVATDLEVVLAIEPMHIGCAAEWTIVTDVEDALQLIASAGSPQLRLALDTYHFGHDPAIVERIAELAPHTAIVHLADGKAPPTGEQNRCPLGQGVLPLKRIVEGLTAAGYEGHFDVELMGEEIESTDYHELLGQTRRAFAELIEA